MVARKLLIVCWVKRGRIGLDVGEGAIDLHEA